MPPSRSRGTGEGSRPITVFNLTAVRLRHRVFRPYYPVMDHWGSEGNGMSSGRRIAAALATAAGVLCAARTAVADESGSFSAIGSFVRD